MVNFQKLPLDKVFIIYIIEAGVSQCQNLTFYKLKFLNKMKTVNYEIFKPTFFHSTKDIIFMWSFGLIKELVPDFQRPSKKLDPRYSGEYDFWLDWKDKKNSNR